MRNHCQIIDESWSFIFGIGGFCLGFNRAEIKTAWAVDNDFYANETYKGNFSGVRLISDPRGKLFYEILWLVKEFKDRKPKAIVLENSPYLRYGEGGIWFPELQKQRQRSGYWFREINCSELNAYDITELPQQRI